MIERFRLATAGSGSLHCQHIGPADRMDSSDIKSKKTKNRAILRSGDIVGIDTTDARANRLRGPNIEQDNRNEHSVRATKENKENTIFENRF